MGGAVALPCKRRHLFILNKQKEEYGAAHSVGVTRSTRVWYWLMVGSEPGLTSNQLSPPAESHLQPPICLNGCGLDILPDRK